MFLFHLKILKDEFTEKNRKFTEDEEHVSDVDSSDKTSNKQTNEDSSKNNLDNMKTTEPKSIPFLKSKLNFKYFFQKSKA